MVLVMDESDAVKTTNPLSLKQQRFVDEYVADPNATTAATRAGYTGKRAGQAGHALLKNPDVRAAIEAKRIRIGVKAEITPAMVLRKWGAVAFAGMDDPDPVKAAAAAADPDPVRLKASEHIARHLGMLDTRIKLERSGESPLEGAQPRELFAMLEGLLQAAKARTSLAEKPPVLLPAGEKRDEAAPANGDGPEEAT